MTSAVVLQPLDRYLSPASAEASTSYRSAYNNNGQGSLYMNGSAGRSNDDNASSSSKGGSKVKKTATSARKKARRFMHEKAPGVSTLVAGHPNGYSGGNSNSNGSRLSSRLAVPNVSSSSSLLPSHTASSLASSSSYKPRGLKVSKGKTKYTRNEVATLIPDEEEGIDALHDPEYQAIKLVERKPSPTSRQHKHTSNGSNTRNHHHLRTNNNNGDNADHHSSDETSSAASSTEDEEEQGMETFSPTASRRSYESRLNPSLRLQPTSTHPSRSYTHRPLGGPASTYGASLSSAYPSPITPTSYSTTALARPPPLGGGGGKSRKSKLGGGGGSSSKDNNSLFSESTYSTGLSSHRTYAGPATYIAPSITMPPERGSSRPEGYNPYTYIPTTAAPSEVFSHSRLPHLGGHHSSSTTQHRRAGGKVDFGPSTTYIYETEDEAQQHAPPIAWQSSFTPSADHPERHKTRLHDENLGTSIKRGIQSVKLDISFGLMRLGKKK